MIDDLGKKDILKIETTKGNIREEYINNLPKRDDFFRHL